jgi:bisphosphoglycerate-dependent phosphoglycerate mutase family 1
MVGLFRPVAGLLAVCLAMASAASPAFTRNPSAPLARGIKMLPGASGRVRKTPQPGTLILVRNGLPDWDLPEEQFIGWADPDLSEEGQMQVRSAARLLVESGHTVDTVHTSMMKRSIRTVWIILHELERIYLPVNKDWRLSARRCGALTGLSEDALVKHYGDEYARAVSRDLSVRPPPTSESLADSEYAATRERQFPMRDADDALEAESIGEALARCEPAWQVRRRARRAAGALEKSSR